MVVGDATTQPGQHSGAVALNDAVGSLEGGVSPDMQIINVTGKGKKTRMTGGRVGYVQEDFLTDKMLPAIVAADVVVSRAGVGAISEFAALRKAVIFVPLPDSPQEGNVRALGNACLSVDAKMEDWHGVILEKIRRLFSDQDERERLGRMLDETFPTDQGEALANLAMSVMV